jgi:hypothetical protein
MVFHQAQMKAQESKIISLCNIHYLYKGEECQGSGDWQKYSHIQAAERSCNTWLASGGHHLYAALSASGSSCNRKLLRT